MQPLDGYDDTLAQTGRLWLSILVAILIVAAFLRLATWDNPEPAMPNCPTPTTEVTVRSASR